MRIGILQTGRIVGDIAERFGDYPEIYTKLLRTADPELETVAYPVVDGEFPASPTECDGWLVTGSKHGVYEDLPWIGPLKSFLRDVRAAGAPLVGICFGHQIMAEAFGGVAEKSDKGWGCGAHEYSVAHAPSWMENAPGEFFSHAMHQDQVTSIPEDATLLAASPFCEFAALTYGDPETPEAISVQCHPEFGEDIARALVDLRAGTSLSREVSDAAYRSFGLPVNNAEMARWFINYYRSAAARREAA